MQRSPITFEALAVLDAIERRGSYAAAAEELNRVPSALSYIVQGLEEKLGVTLFQRQGRRSVLTPAGRHLLAEGRQLMSSAEKLADRTRAIASGLESRITIAIDSMFNNLRTFRIFEQFLERYPDVEIDIREEVLSGGWEALIEDQVDLLIGGAQPIPKQKGIHAVSIAKLDRVFAVARGHPLTHAEQPVSHARIAEERTVVVHDSARTSIPWTSGIVADSRYFFVPTVDCKIRAQAAGIGCGYLPRKRVQHYLDSGDLVEIRIENPPHSETTDMYMAWKITNRGVGLHALKDLFVDYQFDAC